MDHFLQSNIHLRYLCKDNKDGEIFDLSDLGESLVGFDKLFQELIKITKIKGEPKIQATTFRDGSFIVDLVVKSLQESPYIPFDQVDYFLEFLKVFSEESWREAVQFFQELSGTAKTVEDYFDAHPTRLALTIAALAPVLVRLVKLAKKNKNQPCRDCEQLSERLAVDLYKLIDKNKGFKKALVPVVQDKIYSIEISDHKDFVKNNVTINDNNFHEYLGDDEKILPNLENGKKYKFIGEITSMKSSRGDSLTIKCHYNNKEYFLDLLPPDGETTKKYKYYYKEIVNVQAEVIRESYYKKPKLKLSNIDLRQLPLGYPVDVDMKEQILIDYDEENQISS